jgi:ABC-type multidrug transport system fused ATPase/permease subunit
MAGSSRCYEAGGQVSIAEYRKRLCAEHVHYRVGAQLELDFNSVERIVEYLDVPQEKAAIVEDRRPPAWWPSTNGSVVVENLVVKYAPELPPVLQNLSFTINPSEKVGIVSTSRWPAIIN